MHKLIIKEIYNYDYKLVDEEGNIYNLNIEFYSNYIPQINDIIYINGNIIDEVNLYAFDEVYDTRNWDIKDFIKIVRNGDEEHYFQRRYG